MASLGNQVRDLIERLKVAQPFDARHASVALGYALGYDEALFPISTFVNNHPGYMTAEEKNKYIQDIYRRGPSNENNAKDVSKLALATFALGASRMKDEFGFWSSVNQDKARTSCQESLATLMPCLYGHHLESVINEHQAHSLSFDTLSNDRAFFEAYHAEITDKAFVQSVHNYIRTTGQKTYRTNLLFVYEYLRRQGNPQVVVKLADQGVTEVLKSWLEQTDVPSEGASVGAILQKIVRADGTADTSSLYDHKAFAEALFEIVQSVSAIYAPHQRLDTSTITMYTNIIHAALPALSTIPQAVFGSMEEAFQPLGHDVWLAWDDQVDMLKDLLDTQLLSKQTTNGTVETYGGSIAYVMKTHQDSGLFKMTYNNTREVPGSGGLASCFRAGTMVLIPNGAKAIEDLREHDVVLTRADTQEYGTCSDEKVIIPTGGTNQLFGINGCDPFFTANHVFYTTTGLRAIDPVAAQHENPWLQVGTLKIGHVLLKTSNGSSYSRIPIEHFSSELVTCQYVYGLHLRSGLRSYHANGYLVHLNYPEITIASVAKLLQAIPSQQRVTLLGHIKELQPIFAKFGGGFVSDLLSQEVSQPDLLSSMRPKPRGTAPRTLMYETRQYTLMDSGSNYGFMSYQLPDLALRDGVLFVDGKYCERAKISDQEIVWSRPLQDTWEHGMCKMSRTKQRFTGTGIMFYSEAELPLKIPTKTRRVKIVSQTVVPLPELASRAQSLSIQSNFLYSQTELYSKVGSAGLEADAAQLTQDPTLDVPRSSSDKEQVVQADYTLLYDMANFDEKQAVPQPKKSLDLNWKVIGDPDTVQSHTFSIPALDDLAEKRLKMRNDIDVGHQVVPYYRAEVYSDEKNNTMVYLEIEKPDLLAMAADSYTGELDAPLQYENLTFKDSGSDLCLPFIFSRAVFTLDYKDDRVQCGLIRKFDEAMVNNDGTRYRLSGGRTQRVQSSERLMASLSMPETLQVGQPHQAVSVIFETPDVDLLSVDDLSTLPINDGEIKQSTQKIIQLAMAFHMDATDRDTFLKQEKPPPVGDDPLRPDQLPTQLAETLDPKLSSWLRKSYANAYIAYTWSRRSDKEQESAKAKFSKEDRDKLIYFWKGKSKNCMSQQPEYNELHRIALRLALRRQCPRISQYLNDLTPMDPDDPLSVAQPQMKDLTGGEKWAQKLFYNCLTTDVINKLKNGLKVATNSTDNMLNKQCTILSTLLPQEKLSDPNMALDLRLSGIVKRTLHEETTLTSEYVGNAENMTGVIKESVRLLIASILDGTAKFSLELLSQLQQQLDEIDAWAKGISVTQLAPSKIERIVTLVTSPIVGAAQSTVTGLGWKAVDYLHAKWGNQILPEQKLKWMGSMGMILTLGATVAYGFTSWSEWKLWGTDLIDNYDRARMITQALQAATGLGLAACQMKRLWDGSVQSGKLATEVRRATYAEMEVQIFRPAKEAATGAHPKLADPELKPGARIARRASMESEGVQALANNGRGQNAAGAPARRMSMQETLVQSEDALQAKIAQRHQLEGELSDLTNDLKTNYNKTGKWLTRLAAILGFAMLVQSAIAAWRNRGSLDTAETWLVVLQLIHQAICVIVDVLALVRCIPPQVTIALFVIGVVLALIWLIYTTWIKKPEPTPIEKWYNNTGKEYVKNLPDPPQSLCKWATEDLKVQVDKESTLTIVGKGRADKTKSLPRCSSIGFSFAVSKSAPTALFQGEVGFVKTSTIAELAVDQVKITIPETLDSTAYTAVSLPDSGQDDPIWVQPMVAGWPARVNKKDKKIVPQQYLSVEENQEIKFEIKGIGAKKVPDDNAHGDQYSMIITETYLTAEGKPSDVIETEVIINKEG